jgi:hypothetical protein
MIFDFTSSNGRYYKINFYAGDKFNIVWSIEGKIHYTFFAEILNDEIVWFDKTYNKPSDLDKFLERLVKNRVLL